MKKEITFWEVIKIDKQLNSFKSFVVLLMYRIQHYYYDKNNRLLLHAMGVVKFALFRILGIDAQIFYPAQIGHHVKFPHSAMGVVISPKSVIGNNVTIYHQVTLGINGSKPLNKQSIVIKDNCVISVGCKIISCVIGENCRIAPNTCVYEDMPPDMICYTKIEMKSRRM